MTPSKGWLLRHLSGGGAGGGFSGCAEAPGQSVNAGVPTPLSAKLRVSIGDIQPELLGTLCPGGDAEEQGTHGTCYSNATHAQSHPWLLFAGQLQPTGYSVCSRRLSKWLSKRDPILQLCSSFHRLVLLKHFHRSTPTDKDSEPLPTPDRRTQSTKLLRFPQKCMQTFNTKKMHCAGTPGGLSG